MPNKVNKPYWIWALGQTGIERRKTIDLAEFFILLLDRLGSEGYDTKTVIQGLETASMQLENQEIADVAAALAGRTDEEAYPRVREKSRTVLHTLLEAVQEIGPKQTDPESFAPLLLTALDKLSASFKEHIVKFHTQNFEANNRLEPFHLGNMLLCVHALEGIIQTLNPPFQNVHVPFGIDSESLRGVLDWTGDLDETEYHYWYQEFQDIIGAEQKG